MNEREREREREHVVARRKEPIYKLHAQCVAQYTLRAVLAALRFLAA